MSLSVLQVPQQAGGPLVSSYQYSQNQMNDCLNRCISAFMLHKFVVAPSVPSYSGQLVCQSTGDDKVAFPAQQLPDPVGQLARLVFQFLYEYHGTLNQQSSDLLLPSLANPQQCRPTSRAVLSGYQPCCRRKVTAAGVLLPVANLS